MNENIYYLSIASTSLAHYMNKALILPSRFYKSRPEDIQNIKSDYLVLSKNKFLNNSNCSIELVLEKEEIENFVEIEDTNIFLYSKPIPISRIKQIYFIDEMQKRKTIDNINRGTAFIPTRLGKVVIEKNINEENINIDIDDFNYSQELESRIETFNHVLGGVAFVRYTLYGEYTENYFSIWSYFNSSLENNRFTGYDGAFTYKGKVWDKLSPLIYEDILEDDVRKYAKEENIFIEKTNGIFKYETIDNKSITYKLAILNTYGDDSSKRKKTKDLISDCKNGKIPKEKQEGIALIYGINNGYSSFRNQYDKKIVKFKMDSLFDYYTIESVFQYVINDKKDNGKFEYIDSLFPNEELVLDIGGKVFDEEYLENISQYFTKNILHIPLKELFHNITNQFKKTFIEEMDKKDRELKNMKFEIEKLNQKLEEEDKDINNLNKSIEDKNKSISSLKQEIETKDNELQKQQNIVDQLNKDINILNQRLEEKDKKVTFDEEKERIIIEQTLKTYLKYDSKKVPELRKIAKEKGIKYTNKSNTIKSILVHKDNRLL